MSRVAVVTDSAASLPPELAVQWGIDVVPLTVIVDDEPFLEGDQISAPQVVAALTDGRSVSTSQPSIEAFSEAFARAASDGADAVVAVLISGEISGTVAGARTAAASAPMRVEVVDSRTVAMGTGFAAIAAAAVARAGGDADAVAAAAREVADSSRCVFTVSTLEYLRRGGRVSPAVAAIGSVLGVRPVLEVRDGVVVPAAKVRSTAKARTHVLDKAREQIADAPRPVVAVLTAGDEVDGRAVADELHRECPQVLSAVHGPISAVLAGHAGPGAFAVVVADMPEAVGLLDA